jgi:hypothetical protein
VARGLPDAQLEPVAPVGGGGAASSTSAPTTAATSSQARSGSASMSARSAGLGRHGGEQALAVGGERDGHRCSRVPERLRPSSPRPCGACRRAGP